MIGLLAAGALGCEQRSSDPAPAGRSTTPVATAPTAAATAPADGLDARETKLVHLKLPAMV
jgi:hypothetical protein